MRKTKVMRKTKSLKNEASIPIRDGMFFPEDFKKLPKRTVIYIKRGCLVFIDKLGRKR